MNNEENMNSIADAEVQMLENEVAVASVATVSNDCCDCCCGQANASMETAKQISDRALTDGNISCAGGEQWFVFTATRTGNYTIYTTGYADTIGTLYDSCGNVIEENDTYKDCGKNGFRIVHSLTSGKSYYVKVCLKDGKTGSFQLRLTEDVLAETVTINKQKLELTKNVLYELPMTENYTYTGYNGAVPVPGLSVSLNPDNVTEPKVYWHAELGGNLTVIHDWDNNGKRYTHIRAEADGVYELSAYDWLENGKPDVCAVYVGGYPVTGIVMGCESKNICLNESVQLSAAVLPSNAWNKDIIWNSSDDNIAVVDGNGRVTGLDAGTVTITAQAQGGNFSATCTITVDSREKVTIKKDSHSFYVEFADGKVWKNIGIDLSNRQENYNQMNPPHMWYENYDYLIEEEQRYFDNIYVEENGVMEYKKYSVKQIAYLYLLDPIGIEYYMRNHADHDKDIMSGEFLTFRDDVYETIFGNSERLSGRFYFTVVDDKPQYERSFSNRRDVYSIAEVLFGFHTIINWDLEEFIKSVLQGLFEWAMEDSIVGIGIQAYQILFHAGGILGACSDQVSSYVTNYINEGIEDDIENKFGEKARKTCHWALTLVWILADSALSAFSIPNPQDITIYNKVHVVPDFLTVIEGFDGEWSIKDVIDQVNQN